MSKVIQATGGDAGNPIVDEAKAAAGSAIMAGHLVEETTAGEVQGHSTAADGAQKLIALPNTANGNSTDVAYAVGETVRYGCFHSGQKAYMKLAAAATAVTIGAALESAGDGTVRVLTTDAATDDTQRNSVVAYAVEAVDNSGGATEAFIKVRVA
jgi:hypothetical protein